MDQPKETPGRVRRRNLGLRITLLAVLVFMALAGAVIVLPFVLVRNRTVRNTLLDVLPLGSLFAESGQVRIEKIVRIDPWGLRFEGLEVSAGAGDAARPWLRIGLLEANWLPIELLSRRVDVALIHADSVRLEVDRIPKGAPAAGSRDHAPSGPGRLFQVRCGLLEVSRFRARANGRDLALGETHLSLLEVDRGRVRGALGRVSAELPSESLRVHCVGGTIDGYAFSTLALDSTEVVSEGFRAQGDLDLKLGGTAGTEVQANWPSLSLRPSRVSLLSRLSLPLDSTDVVEGSLTARLSLPRGARPGVEARLQLSGFIFGLPLDSLALEGWSAGEEASIESLALRSGDLSVRAEGAWQSPERTAQTDVRFSGLELARGPLARFVSGLPDGRAAGRIRCEIDSIGPGIRVAFELAAEPGRLLGRALPPFNAEGAIRGGGLDLDSLWLAGGEHPEISARGRVGFDPPALDLWVRLDQLALERVVPWAEIPMDGVVDGSLHLFGPAEHPRLSGEVASGPGRVLELRYGAARITEIEGRLDPLDLTCRADVESLDVWGVPVSAATAHARLGDTISVALTARRDTTRLDLLARVIPVSRGAVLIDSLAVQAGSESPVRLERPARLDFAPDRVAVDSLRLRARDAQLSASGWILPGTLVSGREPFAFRLEGQNIDGGRVAGLFGLPVDTLNGTVDLEVLGEGTVDAPRYRARLVARRAETLGWSWDRVRLALRAGELEPGHGGVVIDSLEASGPGFTGRLPRVVPAPVGPARPGRPTTLSADALAFMDDRPWATLVSDLKADPLPALRRLTLRGRLRAERVPALPFLAPLVAERMAAGASATLAEPIDPMSRVIHVVRADATSSGAGAGMELAGRIDASLELAGTGAQPELSARLVARRLAVLAARADSVVFEGRYAAGALEVKRLDWMVEQAKVHAEGLVPLKVEVAERPISLPRAPVDIRIDIPGVDLSLASLVTNLILEPAGTLTGRLAVRGVAPRIHAEGELAVADGSFRIPNREERMTGAAARLHLDSLGVHVDEATARMGDEGKVVAYGTYLDDKHFDFTVKARQAPIVESGNYRFTADGDLRALTVQDGDSLRPLLRGNVRVDEGLLTMDLAKQPPGGPQPLRTPFLMDIKVTAPKDLQLVDPRSNLNLSVDSLRIGYRYPLWRMDGEINIEGGRYRLLNYYFRVVSGKVTFADTQTGPHPEFDIQAVTDVDDDRSEGRLTITVDVTGPVEAPSVSLSSSDGRPEPEILALLSLGQLGSQAGRLSGANPAAQVATAEVYGKLEEELFRSVPWATKVQLVSGFEENTPWRVAVRPISTRQWSLSYTQALTANPDRELDLDYRLSRLLFLNASLDRQQLTEGTVNETYTLDLQFRLDY